MITITVNDMPIAYDEKKDSRISLLELLRTNGVYLSAPCNGQGRCGKCGVTVLHGQLAVSPEDKLIFTEQELTVGHRLACTAYPTCDLTIEVDARGEEADFTVVVDSAGTSSSAASSRSARSTAMNPALTSITNAPLSIAIDIGTTTLAAVLLDNTTGEQLASATGLNHQRMYGADVISRITAANGGHLKELQALILSDLRTLIDKLLDSYSQPALSPQATRSGDHPDAMNDISTISNIMIGANTTMVHLLMGFSCQTLGEYPFSPVHLDTIRTTAGALLITDSQTNSSTPRLPSSCPVTILPGISAFVGGDIVSGISSCGMADTDEISFLIDLGTNGEIALGNRNRILVASTSAGPAFEAGNISCGIGSIAGAISNVNLISGRPILGLIGGSVTPVGLCGTGVIALTSELLRNGIIDSTGTFTDHIYQQHGYPLTASTHAAVTGTSPVQDHPTLMFTQEDIRQLQLAKAAICAGMQTLLDRYGIHAADVAHIYVAGGFGQKLDKRKALSIGLFPKEFCNRKNQSKLVMIGNSCLSGLVALSTSSAQASSSSLPVESIIKKSVEISLSTDPDFQELYLHCMSF